MFDSPRLWTGECDLDDDVASIAHEERRARLWEEAVRALTAAARLRHPAHGRIDFADFVATALGAVAANVSGADELLAGRPGSWEAVHIADLLAGVLGDDPEVLLRLRTESVVVPLNVDQLVRDAFSAAPAGEQDSRLPDLLTALEDVVNQSPDVDEDEVEARLEALPGAYARAYERYAARFEAELAALVSAEFRGLRVPVRVEAATTPDASWTAGAVRNPDPDGDVLVWRLWSAARERAGWPQLEGSSNLGGQLADGC